MYSNRFVTILYAALLCAAVSVLAAPPTAQPDSYSVNEDTTLPISAPGVLGNDNNGGGGTLTALLASAPANGTLTFTSNGSFSYRPNTNYFGVDTFIYRARTSQGTSSPVTVTITINPINDTPRATNDNYSLASDTTLTVNTPGILANDYDADGNSLTAVLGSAVTNGTLVLNGDGSFNYTPKTGYAGVDAFRYRASDNITNSTLATVLFNVVPAPIVVASSPSNQIVCVGEDVTFSVAASGTGLRFQWFKDTQLLNGETNHTLMLEDVTGAAAGIYSVRLSGATNSVTNSTTLTVNTPISTTPLANATRMVGSMVSFNVSANGSGPMTYTWYHDGEIIADQSGGSLILSNLLVEHSGTYSAVVSNPCGSVTNSATLTVATCFNSFDVMLVIDRSGSMSGQAYVDARNAATNFVHNLNLTGETNDTLGLASYNPTSILNQQLTNSPLAMKEAIHNLGPATNGTCISCGIITAQTELVSPRRREDALPVMVLLTDGLPKDFDTPSNALYNVHQAKLSGTRVFTVAFGTNVDSALMMSMASQPSDYFYASNSAQLGALFDAISTVICRPPTNIFGPENLAVCAGTNVELNVSASGCALFNFQWLKDNVALIGETNSTLALGTVGITNSGVYSVIVSSVCRTVTNRAIVTVNGPATIEVPVVNQANYLSSNATFTVQAGGTTLSYAWWFNGQIVGTGSSLVLTNLTREHAGEYCVVVTGADCGGAVTNCATLTILNRAPTAANDNYSILEDQTLNVSAPGVLANDTDPDADALTAELVTIVAHGTLNFLPNGTFEYQPNFNFHGTDTFTYRVSDGSFNSEVVTVGISVIPQNDAPVAANDSYSLTEDATLVISAPGVLGNDNDVDGDVLSAVVIDGLTSGGLALNADGSFVYTPSLNFTGTVTFSYRAHDGTAASDLATITIHVMAENDVPVVADDAFTLAEDTVLTIGAPGILVNDLDVDGDALMAILISDVTHGTLDLNANGAFTYTPSTNFNGADAFTYYVSDGVATSSVATVRITVTPVNDHPTVGASDEYSVLEDGVLTLAAPGVLGNDADVDGNTLTAVLVSGTIHGTLALNADGSFTYKPAPDFFGSDAFKYVASDGGLSSSSATVNITVTPVNDAPSFAGASNQRVNFNARAQTVANFATAISAGPVNEESQSVHFELNNDNPSLFAVAPAISAAGVLSYTPNGTSFGVANLTAVLRDDAGATDGGMDSSLPRSFSIVLNGPPFVSIASPTNNTTYVGTNTVTVVAQAGDPDSVVTNVTILAGTNVLSSASEAPWFASIPNAPLGMYQFRAIATDDLGLTATSALVSVTVTQNPPVTALGPIVLNHQYGLFEQFVRISNSTPKLFPNGMRLFIHGMDSTNRVYNASGTNNNGVPFIDVFQPLPSMGFLDVRVQYYVPNPRSVPSPVLVAEPLPFTEPQVPAPVIAVVGKTDDVLSVRFQSASGRLYYLQASEDFVEWKTIPGLILGNGGTITCTNALNSGQKFFRILLLP